VNKEKDERVRVRHMLDAAHKALEFTQGRSRADLDTVWQIITNDLPPLVQALETLDLTGDVPDTSAS